MKKKLITIAGILTFISLDILNWQEKLADVFLDEEVVRLFRNDQAPDFHLGKVGGGEMSLADLKGEYKTLIFVRYSCSHCFQLKERLIQPDFEHTRSNIIWITQKDRTFKELDAKEAEIEANIEEVFTVLIDSTGTVFDSYKISTFPTSYTLNEGGRIVGVAIGFPGCLNVVSNL